MLLFISSIVRDSLEYILSVWMRFGCCGCRVVWVEQIRNGMAQYSGEYLRVTLTSFGRSKRAIQREFDVETFLHDAQDTVCLRSPCTDFNIIEGFYQ
jgi:hypothetical protein